MNKNIIKEFVAFVINMIEIIMILVLFWVCKVGITKDYIHVFKGYKENEKAAQEFVENKYDIDVELKSWEPCMYSPFCEFTGEYYYTYSYKDTEIHTFISPSKKFIGDDYEMEEIEKDIYEDTSSEIKEFSDVECKVTIREMGVGGDGKGYLSERYDNNILTVKEGLAAKAGLAVLVINIDVYDMKEKDIEKLIDMLTKKYTKGEGMAYIYINLYGNKYENIQDISIYIEENEVTSIDVR